MRKTPSRIVQILFTALWIVTPSLMAGIRIVESQQFVFHAGGDKIFRIAIDGERVAVDIIQGDNHRAIILRDDLGVLWLVDYKEKVYREVTRNLIGNLQDRRDETTSAASARVNEQIATLTPEQRRDLEAMMQARVSSNSPSAATAEPFETIFQRTDISQKPGPWTCDWYEGQRGGEKVWEVCAVDWLALGLQPEQFSGLSRLRSLLEKFSPADAVGFLQAGANNWQSSPGYPGMPVSRISYLEGRMQVLYEVTVIEQTVLADAAFEAPTDFEKRALLALEGF
jgi:hypothetical protein